MPEIDYITCADCQTEWIDYCAFCKKRAWQRKIVRVKKIRKVRIIKHAVSHKKYIPIRVRVLVNQGHPLHCNCCFSVYDLTFDHVIPKAKGGEDHYENGQILCKKCNTLKADKILTIEELRYKFYSNCG